MQRGPPHQPRFATVGEWHLFCLTCNVRDQNGDVVDAALQKIPCRRGLAAGLRPVSAASGLKSSLHAWRASRRTDEGGRSMEKQRCEAGLFVVHCLSACGLSGSEALGAAGRRGARPVSTMVATATARRGSALPIALATRARLTLRVVPR